MSRPSILQFIIFFLFLINTSSLWAQPTAVATYNCLGIYWNEVGGEGISCTTEYKKSDDTVWAKAQDLWWDARPAEELHGEEYRGSIVGLEPGTAYDVKLSLSDGTTQTLAVSTWDDPASLPIAQTINIPSQSSGYTITNGGSATGYIVYDGTGTTITGGENVGVTIDADYIILRGLTISNVGPHGIELMDVNHVIIEDCDISGWGTESGGYQTEDDCGIWSNKCGLNTITIQNCEIHHPRYDTNNWDETNPTTGGNHPEGANAISFECQEDDLIPVTGNYVIRNNTIYSDYEHMFNDAIGADNNFSYNGFPIRDSDIYGNEVSHVWDDALEVEGGNMNVRVWENSLDSINIAFGLATTSIGPLYVFRNISRWGKAKPNREWGWSMFKLGDADDTWNKGAMFLYHNTIRQPDDHGVYDGFAPPTSANVQHNITSRNNILHVLGTSIDTNAETTMPNSTFDYDLCNGDVPDYTEPNGVLDASPVYILGTDTLDTDSPGLDAGVVLWNFNDKNSAWPYSGNRPEIGAIESSMPTLLNTTLPIRVNIGGPAYTSAAGDLFLADQHYTSNTSWGYTSIGYTESRPIVDILDTEEDDLYLTERWWEETANGAYVFNVPNGLYDLKLHFMEFNDVTIGTVQFDVKIENNTILNDFDIRSEVAQQTALVKSITDVNVSDGQLNIDLTPLMGSAGSKIMAIEIMETPTAIEKQLKTANAFRVYPNPTAGNQVLHYNILAADKVNNLALYDMNGRKIKSFAIDSTTTFFSIDGIAAGAYVIRARSGGYTYARLLIVQ